MYQFFEGVIFLVLGCEGLRIPFLEEPVNLVSIFNEVLTETSVDVAQPS